MNETSIEQKRRIGTRGWVYLVLLVFILLAGGYLRFVGLDWDQQQHLHPDERFLTMVESAIQPVDSIGEYFNTDVSTLNPHNVGHTFFVYGTLPIFIVRYVGQWLGSTGYGEIYLVGRALSAVADLLTVLLIFLLASRLYDRRVGVLAAAFSAFTVLQIQQSHFFTVDTFLTFFMFLALYFSVEIATASTRIIEQPRATSWDFTKKYLPGFIFFGMALGMAVASKVNATPVAIILPAAALILYFRIDRDIRQRYLVHLFTFLVTAALVSVVTFRIFQPYAFEGPGFFGFLPNSDWIANIKTLQAQTSGDVDFPPAIQWARRPIWFSFQNMVLWGMGLPLGLLAWTGFLWMGYRIMRGEWRTHVLLWGWTGAYFAWQSSVWNSTMRYQLPIYPALAVIAAWAVIALWDLGKDSSRLKLRIGNKPISSWVPRLGASVIGMVVLILTMLWGYAFANIYTTDHPRVEATRWLIQNLPGPITIPIDIGQDEYSHPISFPDGLTITEDQPYFTNFLAPQTGTVSQIELPHVVDKRVSQDVGNVLITLEKLSDDGETIGFYTIQAGDIPPAGSPQEYWLPIDSAIDMLIGDTFSISITVENGLQNVAICEDIQLQIQTAEELIIESLQPPKDCLVDAGTRYSMTFTANVDGTLYAILLPSIAHYQQYQSTEQQLSVLVQNSNGEILTEGSISSYFSEQDEDSYKIDLIEPFHVDENQTYSLTFDLVGPGSLDPTGTSIANETSWDDGLPLRMDGYDPFGGIYVSGLNFEMYWDDNQEKLNRFIDVMSHSEYILITSSRQWGSTTRIPERYPLTIQYYRSLIGCPAEQTIEWCYNVAQPGQFEGDLGFELVETFQSNPHIGNFEINDQPSEEAFTVYDHPKVFVFRKTDQFSSIHVAEILGSVDLSSVVHITPRQADDYPGDLMLPESRLEEQREGGTWSELYNPDALHNRIQIIGVVVWYLAVTLLGLIAYPALRFVLPGLSDRGYPFARLTGLLVLAWLVWLAGSYRIPFNRWTIAGALLLMILVGLFLVFRQWEGLKLEWKERKTYFLIIEGLFLAFFIAGLLVRFGNPDLWHPWKGGEKPMDFAYFNAVLKSTSFPPYDPWFAGGYINYYYFGFVVVGVLVKFLGIVPAFAYNLILPTIFAMIAMGAFSLVWNIVRRNGGSSERRYRGSVFAGLLGAFGMAVLGNLGIMKMIAEGYQVIAAPPIPINEGSIFQRLVWTFQGFVNSLQGAQLPYRLDEWYWNPSRVIAAQHGDPITEFPYFTFLYGDLHAHLIALPIALLVLLWAWSVIKSRAWMVHENRSALRVGVGLFTGALIIGALYPINLSDIYTYLPIGVAALAYGAWRGFTMLEIEDERLRRKKLLQTLIFMGLSATVLYVLSTLLYQPYHNWYGQGYSETAMWTGSNTPILEYLTHWGLFIFVIGAWMLFETIDWMANTPLSALNKIKPHRETILFVIAILVLIILVLGLDLGMTDELGQPSLVGMGVHVIWFVLPMAAWAGVLLLRPGISDAKRFVLFLIGTGLVLTLMVEVVYVRGDIGRMNTVFKFYLHTWTIFAVVSAAAFYWSWQNIHRWASGWRLIYQVFLIFFVATAALFPLVGTFARIQDRMSETTPNTLDGMEYMAHSTNFDLDTSMDLNQDYQAIRWMQENVEGSPVIVEANLVEYHWGSRFSIYTGLPGVVGWNWHQRQQRAINPDTWVFNRVEAVHNFYQTEDLDQAFLFLDRYDVQYIIVGQQERAHYPGPGLEKFQIFDGVYWDSVYEDRETRIYRVQQEVYE